MITKTYHIGGMSCAACAASIEKRTMRLEGTAESSVNLVAEKLTITYDESKLSEQDIISAVEKLEFTIKPFEEVTKVEAAEEDAGTKTGLILSCIFAALLLYISMGQMLIKGLPVPGIVNMHMHPFGFAISQMILALAIMIIGRKKFVSGFKSLFHGSPNMDTLVALSCSCAFIYSLVMTALMTKSPENVHNLYFESCGVVLTFISLGKYLESRSKEKTKDAITGLMNLAPLKAMLIKDGNPVEVDASEIKPGDVVLVLSGARVPCDGIVIDGEAELDESAFTGESLPVHKDFGASVICGSVNTSGSVYVEVRKVGKDTTLAGIVQFVEDAQGKKAPIQSLADKVAGVFVPAVMGIALVAAVIWLLAGYSFSFALKVFTCVLVIACPCALGLATPTAIICGTGLGAQNGILIRSGEALETTKNVDVVVLDKTGTVTKGKPIVSDILALDGYTNEDILSIAGEVEKYSDHPLAKAVAKARPSAAKAEVEDFSYVSGRGMKASLKDGRAVICGNAAMLEEAEINHSGADEFLIAKGLEGKSCILVSLDGKCIGGIALSDELKDGSKELIDKLKAMNIKTILLTGDSSGAARYVAKTLGVDKVIGGVLPKDKASVVEEIKKDGSCVMMVGDGVNDAPALVTADVGCAIGSGSDIAIDSADIVLMKDNPLDVEKAITLSRLTIRNIKQNLFWAFFYNCIGIPIAAGVLYPAFNLLLSPMIGGLAMSFSSVFVVTNALRLKTKKL